MKGVFVSLQIVEGKKKGSRGPKINSRALRHCNGIEDPTRASTDVLILGQSRVELCLLFR